MDDRMLLVTDKKDEKFLRERTKEFAFSPKGEPMIGGQKFTKQAMSALVGRMKKAMKAANGIGLSANQIGLPYRIFIAHVPDPQGLYKLYVILNPMIEKSGGKKTSVEEGCLSVPGIYGEVERHDQIVLRGADRSGKPLKIKAWGLLARVFQHEIDHLDGKLFIDRTKKLSVARPKE